MKSNLPPADIVVNGRTYPLWQQFVQNAEKWIGGTLQDDGDSMDRRMGAERSGTEIVEVQLRPNGDDSAFFAVIGKDFECGFDVKYGGVTSGETGWITFSGYGGHSWRIREKSAEARP